MDDLIKNIMTFGAHGKIQKKENEFKKELLSLEKLNESLEEKVASTNLSLETLVASKVTAANCLKLMSKITKNIKVKDRESENIEITGTDLFFKELGDIDNTIKAFDIAINISKGVASGASTALGAWALAGYIGTASTGTAISSLSGVAATNATLAWLGGGAVAAGGGGVAAGTMVLYGLATIPALAVTGVFSHLSANKKIEAIEKEMLKLVKRKDEIEKNILFTELTKKRADELIATTNKASDVFKIEFKRTIRKIYPFPVFSRLRKWTRQKFGHSYFSISDIEHIAYIGGLATNLSKIIDTKVFNSDGTLTS